MYPGAQDRVDGHSTGISCCNLDIMLLHPLISFKYWSSFLSIAMYSGCFHCTLCPHPI